MSEYEIEIAGPSFCGTCGDGSQVYVFDSYAEVMAFREGLDAAAAEYKVVKRFGDNSEFWAYEGEQDFKTSMTIKEVFEALTKAELDAELVEIFDDCIWVKIEVEEDE